MFQHALANIRTIDDHIHARRLERPDRTDARQLEQLGRHDRSCRENHLSTGSKLHRSTAETALDTLRAPLLDQHLVDMDVRLDDQVGPVPNRFQKSDRCVLALPILDIIVIVADALTITDVEIVVAWQPHLLACLNHAIGQRITEFGRRNMYRAARAMLLACAQFMIFDCVERGQHGAPPPALRTSRLPLLIILRLTPNVDHAIDRGGAAKSPAPDPDLARVHISFARLLDGEILCECWVTDELRDAFWHANHHIFIRSTRLQQQDAGGRTFRQPISQYAASAASADDDIIKLLSHTLSAFIIRQVSCIIFYDTSDRFDQ
ncbi:hypothetical protein D3C84_550110 [compost metagenome]